MRLTLLDFSTVEDLRPLARLVGAIRAASGGATPFMIAGAQARDLLLRYGRGIDPGRQTADVDFAFQVANWEAFQAIRSALIASGNFEPVAALPAKLKFRGQVEVDILPFGDIEDAARNIAWRPGHAIMSMFGFREAFKTAGQVCLPGSVFAKVVSLAGLALLKLEAWRNRRLTAPGKDAHDLKLVLRHYLPADGLDRIVAECPALLEDENFDYDCAGAFILGRDIRALLDAQGLTRVTQLVEAEADEGGNLRLAGDMRMEVPLALALLGSLRDGLEDI